MTDIERRLSLANGRLRAAKVGVIIQARGGKLYLQATLPPKPTSLKKEPYQQRIALGTNVNGSGISYAEAEARKIGALLGCKQFDWHPYLAIASTNTTIATLLAEFEKDYFTRRQRNPKSQTTWDKDYLAVISRLPQAQELTSEVIVGAIALTAPDSRQRKRFCMVLSAFAKFANLAIDIKRYAGSYNPRRAKPRDLPDDLLIQTWFEQIPDPAWQWFYGMLATYGLRPHEAFYIDFDLYPIATVSEGKTGARRIWACYPEWASKWNLQSALKPHVNAKNNSELGAKAGRYFKRIGLPFHLYDLRHSWAVRTLEFGLDLSLAAQQMGHSVQVHSDLYHAWISDTHHQKAYDAIMQRGDRPKPPK
jgi:integrase